MKRTLSLVALLLLLSVALILPASTGRVVSAAPASAPVRVHVQAFDKTRFLLHLGVAAFLIHYVYKKYKDGKLSHFHLFTDLKAAAALLIAYHELKTAYDIAKSSKSKTLQLLIAPMNDLTSAVNAAKGKVSHGDTSSLNDLESSVGSLSSLASKNGFGFKDTQPAGFAGF